jgi:capsid protein
MGRIWKAIHAARAAWGNVPVGIPVADAPLARVVNTEATTTVPAANVPTPFGTGSSGMRSSATFWPLKDLREAKPVDRRESQKTSRWLRNRLGLAKALFEGTARHALGEGLSPSSDSGDREYDKRVDDLVDQIANRPTFDVRREHTFYRMQPLLLQDMICDGDAGAAKVRSAENLPCLQLFSAEAIDNNGTEAMSEGWREGILRNLEGAALKYRIIKEPVPGQAWGPRRSWDYQASEFLHVARFDRININRPMPWLNHGHGSCVTMLDLRELELKVAVLNSYFAGAITTPDGEAPDAIAEALVNRRAKKNNQKADGTTEQVDTVRKYAEFFGGAALPVLREGEKLEFFRNDRQSSTFTGFIDWLVNDIAWGLGVPPQFVWAVMGMTGPNARLILQQSEWFFKHLQSVMVERFCQPVWESLVAEALNRNIIKPPKAGAVWNAVHWQGPQSMSIDKGRDGQLFKDLVNGGMMARSEWHEMNAKHGRNHRRRIMDELAEDLEYCKTKGIPMELYFGTAPGQMGAPGAGRNAEVEPEKIAEQVVNLLDAQGYFRRN